MEKTTNRLWAVRALGGAYLIFLLFLFLLWRRSQTYQDMPIADYIKLFSNYVPLKTTIEQIKLLNAGLINKRIVVSNTIAHIVAFIPFGMMVTIGWKQKWQFHLAVVVSISLLVELLQLFFRIGSFDVDALLFNVLGYFIGFWLIHAIVKVMRRKDDHNAQKNN